jgi:hypothetical protein
MLIELPENSSKGEYSKPGTCILSRMKQLCGLVSAQIVRRIFPFWDGRGRANFAWEQTVLVTIKPGEGLNLLDMGGAAAAPVTTLLAGADQSSRGIEGGGRTERRKCEPGPTQRVEVELEIWCRGRASHSQVTSHFCGSIEVNVVNWMCPVSQISLFVYTVTP